MSKRAKWDQLADQGKPPDTPVDAEWMELIEWAQRHRPDVYQHMLDAPLDPPTRNAYKQRARKLVNEYIGSRTFKGFGLPAFRVVLSASGLLHLIVAPVPVQSTLCDTYAEWEPSSEERFFTDRGVKRCRRCLFCIADYIKDEDEQRRFIAAVPRFVAKGADGQSYLDFDDAPVQKNDGPTETIEVFRHEESA